MSTHLGKTSFLHFFQVQFQSKYFHASLVITTSYTQPLQWGEGKHRGLWTGGFHLLLLPCLFFFLLHCRFSRGCNAFWGVPAPAQAHPWVQSLWESTCFLHRLQPLQGQGMSAPPQSMSSSSSDASVPSVRSQSFCFLFPSLSLVFCPFWSVSTEVSPT